ncbi:glycoside hydrolase family 19 protein [Paraburkholderia phenoliruptrix]|uniref:glycoside hydrolase family 19 protein n=1 Tax=Paraburkholderia phenoliruptrix TaxID=252970 RepID=UPI0028547D75|nr:glycoside hydrolase family 19 protein [Paraburkholderia phenoliruptrix]MDR6389251.1 putative chitinase [Paraburkholderia phenoliruptrix]MDR6421254.1 putative chitinase [Paraburkholderia phenoliruptrix]
MQLNASIIAAGCGATVLRAAQWLQPIQAACDKYLITAPLDVAAFLATVGVESARLTLLRELWGPTEEQKRYEPPSDKAKALGNTDPGDGFKYRGRGCIQITGKANYALCGLALDLDLINHPELLEQTADAALSAAWFWHNNKLSALAGDFLAVSRAVNLGNPHSKAMPNGYSERLALYAAAKKALGL